MKKIVLVLCIITTMAYTSFSVSASDNWVNAGYFVLHNTRNLNSIGQYDPLIINHLLPLNGQSIGTGKEQYRIYSVYYKHSHAQDWENKNANYADFGYGFSVKLIPSNGPAMMIICDYKISPKGILGITVNSYKVIDIGTDKVLYEGSGIVGTESLYKNTAAEKILKNTAPHPVMNSCQDILNGDGYYNQ